jgi:hypothetical protein
VCGLVLKRNLDVWDFVFNEAFTEASRNVIQLWFSSVNLGLASSDALNLLRSDEGNASSTPVSSRHVVPHSCVCATDLSIGHYVWRVEAGRMVVAATPLGRRGEALDTLKQKASTLTPRLSELVAHFDQQLEACMLDLTNLLGHLTAASAAAAAAAAASNGSHPCSFSRSCVWL